MDEINIGQWSSGQVGEGKSMCLRWFRSCRTGERYCRSNRKMERPSWRSQEVFVVPRRSGTRRRTDWIRVENSQDFRHYLFFARSRTTWRQRTSSQNTSRTGSSSCQCSMTLYGKRMMIIVFRMPKKSKKTRHEVPTRTLDVSGPRIGREVVWQFHIRPDLDMMRRIKAASEVLKAPCFRTSSINARGYKHGRNLWQEHHHKAKDTLRGGSKTKRQFASIWDRWQSDETFRESQHAINWSDAWWDTWTILQKSTPPIQRRTCKGIDTTIYLRSVNEDKQAPPLPQRPGYQDAKKALVEMHKQVRQDCGVTFISKVERQRLRN